VGEMNETKNPDEEKSEASAGRSANVELLTDVYYVICHLLLAPLAFTIANKVRFKILILIER
jgi:hypothetical protein